MKAFTKFLGSLSRLNKLEKKGPVQWYFYPGMLFSTMDKWWGNFGFRATLHEGIDITYYSDGSGTLCQFNSHTRIPALKSGMVLNICDDFLGKSIIIEPFHRHHALDSRILFIYAHIVPLQHIHQGCVVMEDEPIATVSHTRKNPQLPPHLHFSCIEIPRTIHTSELDWSYFSQDPDIQLYPPWFL